MVLLFKSALTHVKLHLAESSIVQMSGVKIYCQTWHTYAKSENSLCQTHMIHNAKMGPRQNPEQQFAKSPQGLFSVSVLKYRLVAKLSLCITTRPFHSGTVKVTKAKAAIADPIGIAYALPDKVLHVYDIMQNHENSAMRACF